MGLVNAAVTSADFVAQGDTNVPQMRAGVHAFANGDLTATITFGVPMPSSTYVVMLSFLSSPDTGDTLSAANLHPENFVINSPGNNPIVAWFVIEYL